MSKSVEELFKDAPEDATHYAKQCHYKLVGDMWMVYIDDNEWATSDSMYNGQIKPSDIIQRPQPKPWSGPEDGLPPLGVEVDFDYQDHPQGSGKVLFYGNEFCIVQNTTGGEPYEQVALIEDYSFKCLHKVGSLLEKRETAIREIMDVADVDCRVTAARLVDAGFKREVV